jgi:phosphate:Na+ symporter
MVHLIQIVSGVALILFGVRFLREGVDRILGPRLDEVIEHLTQQTPLAFIAGLGIGAVIPSSTSVSMLITEAFQTRAIKARNALPLMFGADVGITTLVLVTSLHLEMAVPGLIIIGVVLYQFTQAARSRGTGQVFLSLAFIFMAVTAINSAGGAVSRNADFVNLIQIAEHTPSTLALLSGVLAILFQSSTATILLVASFGSTASLSLPLTLFVVVGANLGIAVTRLAIGWHIIEARRLAMAGLLNRMLVACAIVLFSDSIVHLFNGSPFQYAFTVALMHLGFNLLAAATGILLAGVLINLTERMISAPPGTHDEHIFGTRYITTDMLTAPRLALGQSLREILRAAEIVREMLNDLWQALENSDETLARAVSRRDDQVDLLDKEVKRFLSQIAELDLDSETADEQMRQLRFLSEIEAIGDIVDKNLSEIVLKKVHCKLAFTEDDRQDLQSFFLKVRENMVIAETAFQTRDRKLAAQLRRHKEFLNRYHRELTDRHLARLRNCTVTPHDSSSIHLDLLANLKRVNSCLSHVAYAVLSVGGPSMGLSPALQATSPTARTRV